MKTTSCCLLCGILFLGGCRDSVNSPKKVAQSEPQGAVNTENETSHQFGDFSFVIPQGWKVVPPDRDKTKAMLLLGGTTWQDAKAMIKVDVGAPSKPDTRAMTNAFVETVGGTISPDSLDFDGAEGVLATTSSTELTTPRQLIVIFHKNQAYLLMVGAIEGVEVTDTIESVRSSWKWSE